MYFDTFLHLFVLLVFVHFLADFPLQGEFMAKAKNPSSPIPAVPWYTVMAGHCFIHAGFVYLITGSLILLLIEFVAHFLIDFYKCWNDITFNKDQFLHLVLKVCYAAAVSMGLVTISF